VLLTQANVGKVLQAEIEICGALSKPIWQSVISLSLVIITIILIVLLTVKQSSELPFSTWTLLFDLSWLSTVSRQFLTAEARVQAQGSPCGIYHGEIPLGQVFLREFRFPVLIISPLVLHIISGWYNKRIWVSRIKRFSLIPLTQLKEETSTFCVVSVLLQNRWTVK
jgi:hypothetical protein